MGLAPLAWETPQLLPYQRSFPSPGPEPGERAGRALWQPPSSVTLACQQRIRPVLLLRSLCHAFPRVAPATLWHPGGVESSLGHRLLGSYLYFLGAGPAAQSVGGEQHTEPDA